MKDSLHYCIQAWQTVKLCAFFRRKKQSSGKNGGILNYSFSQSTDSCLEYSTMDKPRYHISPVDLQQVLQSVKISDPAKVAPLILCISPCRSGSTILLRVFGASGLPAYYQPWKNILRWAMQGLPWRWDFPESDQPIFIKETLGPYTQIEATFNPFEVIHTCGYPLEKLRLLFVGRDPRQTWSSWHTTWGEKTDIQTFISAYQQADLIRRQILAAGLPLVHFVYESIRDFGAETAIKSLFKQLGLKFTSHTIARWDELPPFGAPGSNIFFPEEPPAFFLPTLHGRAENADRLAYAFKPEPIPGCTPEVLAIIKENRLDNLFAGWQANNYVYLPARVPMNE